MSGLPVIRSRYRPRTARTPLAAAVYLLAPLALAALLAAKMRSIAAGMEPRERREAAPTAAFVRLGPELCAAAMARVRTSWQLERGAPESVEFDPAVAAFELAERVPLPVSVARPGMPRPSFAAKASLRAGPSSLLPPSLAAPPPSKLAEDLAPLAAESLFPRSELLYFDGMKPFKKGTRR